MLGRALLVGILTIAAGLPLALIGAALAGLVPSILWLSSVYLLSILTVQQAVL